MRWLHWTLLLLLTLFWQTIPGSAAERVLLQAAGQSQASIEGGATLSTSAAVTGLRATAQRNGTVKVIVGLKVPFAPASKLGTAEAQRQGREIAAASTALRARFAAAITRAPSSFRSYSSIPFVALEVTPAELDKLSTDPDVISITENMVLRANLAQSAALIRAPQAWADGYTGKDQTIAIIDSGVDKNHPFLGGRIVSEACYTNRQCPGGSSSSTSSGSGMPCVGSTECDHGTHVAGIAAGYSSNAFSGIAPDATLISINVFTSSGGRTGANAADVLAALERVYQLRGSYSISAVNMSLGWSVRFSTTCDDALPSMTAAINQLKAAGIAAIISSGNDGSSSSISFPACISSAVSVGSVSDSNWGTCGGAGIASSPTAVDKVACYSNAYEELSLLAPGSPILSSIPGGAYATKHGTSMAAPHVAGAFAVLRQKAPGASVDDILTTLRDTGQSVTDYRNAAITTPRIDVMEALEKIDTSDGRLAINLTINGKGTVTFSPAGSKSSCTASCVSTYAPGTSVTLTATPGASMSFAGWGGACAGQATCTITMTAAKSVFAAFFPISSGPPTTLSISKTGGGAGSISVLADGQETSCSGSCARSYGKNTKVILTANAAYGAALTTWTGACRGKKSTCIVRLSSAKSVGANFETLPIYSLSYAKAGAASGTVQISSSGQTLTCGDSCTNPFPAGARITLTAVPATGKIFGGWSGICGGRKTQCSFTLRSTGSVSAVFN